MYNATEVEFREEGQLIERINHNNGEE